MPLLSIVGPAKKILLPPIVKVPLQVRYQEPVSGINIECSRQYTCVFPVIVFIGKE